MFNKFKNEVKGTWKTINGILNKTKRKFIFSNFFKDGEIILYNKNVITNKFNEYFTNIGPNLSNQIKTLRNKSFDQYLSQKYTDQFNCQNINEQDILLTVDKLAPKSSCGFDGISSKIIKMLKVSLAKPITLIINQMLNTGIFPDKLKIAKIIPIYKKDDETLFTNYTSISLLPTIFKIFEKVIFMQIYSFFSSIFVFL